MSKACCKREQVSVTRQVAIDKDSNEQIEAPVAGKKDLRPPWYLRTSFLLGFYACIAVPTLIILSLIVGPFQALDESSHFYRAVQLSEGRAIPVKSAALDSAGDYLDTNMHKLGGYYLFLALHQYKDKFGEGSQDRALVRNFHLSKRTEFVAFSNTVIYFPTAHVIPALTILAVKPFDNKLVDWMYAGRIANAMLAILLFSLALRWAPYGKLFILVLALLPRTLFGTASLSPDSLLVPLSSILSVLTGLLALGCKLTKPQLCFLVVSMFQVAVGKIAYLPLAFIPPLVSILTLHGITRDNRPIVIASAFTVLVWGFWTHIISSSIYTIHPVAVNVYEQLNHVVFRPLHAVSVLFETLLRNGGGYLDSLAGGQLGSSQARFSHPLVALSYFALLSAAIVSSQTVIMRPLVALAVFVIIGSVCLAIFVLLYMQFTALDFPTVDGVQGRYFLPLLSLAVIFSPKLIAPRAVLRALTAGLFIWTAFCCAQTIKLEASRYVNSAAIAGLRFGDPANFKEQ